MEKFRFTTKREGDAAVVSLFGYLENTGGTALKNNFESILQEGILRYVLDFKGIELISSPGVASLLDIGSRVIDDFDGRIAAFGLDSHHSAVLEMSGFFFMVTQAADEGEALRAVRE
ncbi:MAG: STAS domain-containing protein [Candidatus Riflebacteria bacterium]|nr:STAS domain-containing protein [Candidatus Riflebacteria bacterium]